MEQRSIVLIKASTAIGAIDSYSEDFEEIKLGEALALGYLKSYLEQNGRPWNVIIINPLIESLTANEAALRSLSRPLWNVPPTPAGIGPYLSAKRTAVQRLTAREVARRTLDHRPFLVGISLVYQWHRNFAHTVASAIKSGAPGTHVVLGGLYTTSDWIDLLGTGAFDSICKDEGEQTFMELADRLAAGVDWRGTHGLAYMERGIPTFPNNRKRIRDLGTLPYPDRSQLPRILARGGVIQVEASRGCNAGCTFCDVRNTGWKARPEEHLVNEIEELAREYPGAELWFIDNIFIGFGKDRSHLARAERIADELIRRNIRLRFSFQDRADNVEEKLFRKLKRAGLNRVYIGVESFSDSALLRWQKGTPAATNKRALHILRDLEIFTQMGFLVFDGWTSMQEILDNINGLHETAFGNAYLHLHNFNELIPYAGTHLAREYERDYGHAPRYDGTETWIFADPRVKVYRDWSWNYLVRMWPLSECIFHHFDDDIFQTDLPGILPAKNNHFIEYLEALYAIIIAGGDPGEITALCTAALAATKRELIECLDNWSNPRTRAWVAAAIGKIGEQSPVAAHP